MSLQIWGKNLSGDDQETIQKMMQFAKIKKYDVYDVASHDPILSKFAIALTIGKIATNRIKPLCSKNFSIPDFELFRSNKAKKQEIADLLTNVRGYLEKGACTTSNVTDDRNEQSFKLPSSLIEFKRLWETNVTAQIQ